MRISAVVATLSAALMMQGSALALDLGNALGGSGGSRQGSVTDSATGLVGSALPAVGLASSVREPAGREGGLTGTERERGSRDEGLSVIDPTSLIGLPLTTSDAATMGAVEAVQIGAAGEPKVLIAHIATAAGPQQIRLPVELTAMRGGAIEVLASEADVRNFFEALEPGAVRLANVVERSPADVATVPGGLEVATSSSAETEEWLVRQPVIAVATPAQQPQPPSFSATKSIAAPAKATLQPSTTASAPRPQARTIVEPTATKSTAQLAGFSAHGFLGFLLALASTALVVTAARRRNVASLLGNMRLRLTVP